MSDFWNNQNSDESVSEYEMLEDDVEYSEETAKQIESGNVVFDTPEEEYEYIQDESAFELDEHETNVVYNARLRLAQARLYEMLINHNLFEGVEEHPEAVHKVQSELKEYIVERLEILLGIREEKAKQAESVQVDSPFNDVEVEFLKELSYKGTNGRSALVEHTSTNLPKPKPVTARPSGGLKPLQTKARPTPKVIAKSQPAPAPQKKQVVLPTPKKTTPTATKRYAKKKNNTVQKQVKLRSSIGKREMTEAEAEAIARQDLEDLKKRKKPLHKMSAKEKMQEIKRVNDKHSRVKDVEGRIPMMSPEQQEYLYLNREARHSSNPQNINNLILQAIQNQKGQGND